MGRSKRRMVALLGAAALLGGGVASVTAAPTPAGADVPPLEVRVGDVSIPEGTGPSTAAKVVVSLSRPSGTTLCVWLYTPHGTATPDVDYQPKLKPVKFGPQQVSALMSVPVVGDSTDESDETFFVNLFAVRQPSGRSCTSSDPIVSDVVSPRPSGTVTILDDDPLAASRLTVGSVAVPEGNALSTTKAAVPIALSAPFPSSVLCVAFSTTDGTATGAAKSTIHDSSHDYRTRTNYFAKIPAGKVATTLIVPVLGDDTSEGDETLTVTVSGVTLPTAGKCLPGGVDAGISVVGSPATVTILDDDG